MNPPWSLGFLWEALFFTTLTFFKYEKWGLVEIKINEHLIPTNPAKVASLDKKMNRENNIPKRPVMALYDGGEEEEKEEEDIDDDNDNSLV